MLQKKKKKKEEEKHSDLKSVKIETNRLNN